LVDATGKPAAAEVFAAKVPKKIAYDHDAGNQ